MSLFEVQVNGIITHEYHRQVGYTVHVTFYNKTAAGPDTEPCYSCWVEMRNGGRSPELCSDHDNYPLAREDVWKRILTYVDTH